MPSPTRASLWLACLSPLVWIPGGLDRFVFPKLAVMVAAIALGALGARQGRLPREVVTCAGIGVVIFVLACVLSPTPVASLLGRWPRYEGVPVIATYAGSAWLGARLLGGRVRASVGELTTALSVVSVALGLFSVLDALGLHLQGASAESRTGSVLGNATDQGLVGMMLFAALFAVAAERRTPLLLAGAAAGPVTVALSGSRTALVATVLVVALHVLVRRTRVMVRYAAGAAAVVTLLVLVLPQIRGRITNSQSFAGRELLWKESLRVGGDHWLLGAPSTFMDRVGAYRDQDWVREVGTASPPDSPHSWLLQSLVAGGVPLLLAAVVLAGLVIVLGWRAVRSDPDPLTAGLFAATIGYGVGLLPNFTIAGSTCLAAFLAGCLVGVPAGRKEPLLFVRAIAVAAAVAAVWFTLSAFAERSLQEGITAAGQGDIARAQHAFASAHRLRPFDGDVGMFAAESFAGQVSEGAQEAIAPTERWAHQSLDRTPDTYASGLALAVAQIGRHDLIAARRTLDGLVDRYPTEPGARIQRGIVRFGLHDVTGARTDLHAARRLDRRNPVPARILREIRQRLDGDDRL